MGVLRRGIVLRLLAVLAFAALAVAGWSGARFRAPGPLNTDTAVVLERGLSVTGIAQALKAEGLMGNTRVFRVGVQVSGNSRNLRAGEYLIPARASLRDIMNILVAGRTVLRRITVAEGLSAAEVVALVSRADGLDGQTLAAPPEGTLLPETYYFSLGDSRTDVLARMAESMTEALADLWARRAEGLPFDTATEALILASIVEKETALAEERPRIAAVFVNRLRRGMRLQSDPTVVYGLTGGRTPLGRTLTRADTQAPSPYNTYVIDGLPPGPIANPGRAAIEAVLHPAQSDELYFVANGEGGHAFARSLAEHQENVARWRRIQRETGD